MDLTLYALSLLGNLVQINGDAVILHGGKCWYSWYHDLAHDSHRISLWRELARMDHSPLELQELSRNVDILGHIFANLCFGHILQIGYFILGPICISEQPLSQ